MLSEAKIRMATAQEIDEGVWHSEPKYIDCLHTDNGKKVPVNVIARNAPVYTDK